MTKLSINSDTMTVAAVIDRLRQWPTDWNVQLGMCTRTDSDACMRSDVCLIERRAGDAGEYALIHGPMLLHNHIGAHARMTVDVVIQHLREFPRAWPAVLGMDDNIRDLCVVEPCQQVGRHVAGKLIDGALMHGPLINHR